MSERHSARKRIQDKFAYSGEQMYTRQSLRTELARIDRDPSDRCLREEKTGPGSQAGATYICRDPNTARGADPEDYHCAVALRETRGALGAADLVCP
jgi:hypothetical protein